DSLLPRGGCFYELTDSRLTVCPRQGSIPPTSGTQMGQGWRGRGNGAAVSALTAGGRAAHGRTVMTDLRQAPQTRGRRSRFVMALVIGLLTTVVAAGALAQVGKSSLIGKLEGP